MQADLDDKQSPKSPKENGKEMLADDMFPQVLLDDVLGCGGDEPHYEQTHDGE